MIADNRTVTLPDGEAGRRPEPGLCAFLRKAREILAEAAGPSGGPVLVTVCCPESGSRVAYRVVPDPGPCPGFMVSLSRFEKDVVRVLKPAGILPGKAVARRLGMKYDSRFRTLMHNFADRDPPVVVVSHLGYHLARRGKEASP